MNEAAESIGGAGLIAFHILAGSNPSVTPERGGAGRAIARW